MLTRFDSILLGSSFVSQPGIWMSFFVPLCKWAFGTLFHGFAPYLLWCFSLSEPCNLRYLRVLKSSSSTHPVPKAVTHKCRLVLEAMVLGFCGCLYRLFQKNFPSCMDQIAPKRPGNHSFALPSACAVQMPRLQPFRPSGRARLEAINDKTLSPVKATLEEALQDPDPPHSA